MIFKILFIVRNSSETKKLRRNSIFKRHSHEIFNSFLHHNNPGTYQQDEAEE
jgi:hypothetical protein